MHKILRMTALLPMAALFFIATNAFAQEPAPSACTILASKLTPDISSQTSSESRFNIYQNIIKNETFRSFSNARNTSLDAGLTVVGYVDAALNTTSSEANWEKNWSSFTSMTASQFAMSANSAALNSRWNPELISAFVQACPPSGTFFGQLVSVNSGHDGFTIKLHAVNKWNLTGVKASPPDAQLTCNGDEKASEANPIEKIGDRLLNCVKDPNKTVSVAISTSMGDAGPFEIFSVADSLRRQVDDDILSVNRRVSALQDQVTSLSGQLSTQTDILTNTTSALQLIRTEQSYTIVPNASSCPVGWSSLGMVGFLIRTDWVVPAGLGKGGPYGGGEWTWTHPILCRRQ